MNIFVLDQDPVLAARMACDKHVIKMTLETAQMLSSVAADHKIATQYRPTHRGHPCTKWVAASAENYIWTWEHGMALAREYTFRFRNKTHASQRVIESLAGVHGLLPRKGLTPHAQAMPDAYKQHDAVMAYRTFYRAEKARFARWERGREKPYWWPSFSLDTNSNLG